MVLVAVGPGRGTDCDLARHHFVLGDAQELAERRKPSPQLGTARVGVLLEQRQQAARDDVHLRVERAEAVPIIAEPPVEVGGEGLLRQCTCGQIGASHSSVFSECYSATAHPSRPLEAPWAFDKAAVAVGHYHRRTGAERLNRLDGTVENQHVGEGVHEIFQGVKLACEQQRAKQMKLTIAELISVFGSNRVILLHLFKEAPVVLEVERKARASAPEVAKKVQ